MDMSLRLLGVRGSRPVHKATTLQYGGHSTAFELEVPAENFCLFVDAGTGLAAKHPLQGPSQSQHTYYLFLTHPHWDHLLGLPFFAPLYDAKNDVHLFAAATCRADLPTLFKTLFKAPHFPLPLHIQAKVHFHTLATGADFQVADKIRVQTYQLNHQGVTLGYRFTYGADCVAIITDHAPLDQGNFLGDGMPTCHSAKFSTQFEAGLVDFIRGCHTVVFDTHFTEETLKMDWGHSTPDRALQFCLRAQVQRLILFHHAPEDSDTDIEQKLQRCRKQAGATALEIVAAREGEVWKLR